MDVYFYEAFEEEAAALRRHLPSNVQAGFTWKTIQEQDDAGPPAPLISIRTQSRVPPSWADRIAGILSRSTGYDHLERYLETTGRKLPCGHLPLYCHRAVAEQAMLYWTALFRRLPSQMSQFRAFHRDGLTGFECENRTLVVVGVGNIGSEVAKIGQGLGMNVIGVDLDPRHSFVDYAPVEEALPRADVIVCAMNLTPENPCYFNYKRLKAAKRGVLFVNIARGEMSPSADLCRLIEEGHLGGLALDVFNDEEELAVALRGGRTADSEEARATLRLLDFPNVILTPHNAFNTEEAVERKSEQSVQQVTRFLETQEFLWPVP